MTLFEKPVRASVWFRVGLVGLLGLCLGLRFWGLERFNTLVFDEVYYVKFAHNYLAHVPFFDGHPPLSKYLIAIGIWIGNRLPIGQDTINSAAGAAYTTWSYRWLNAFTGAWIPLVIAAIAYQLTHRRSYALIAGWLAALDGLFLVESRYALNNVYLVLFGLLGLWFGLLALGRRSGWQRELWFLASGVAFGASIAIKWNGLWFLLGAYGLWIVATLMHRWQTHWRSRFSFLPPVLPMQANEQVSPLPRLVQLPLWQVGLNWAIVPAIVYRLAWIPHLQMNPADNFWNLQAQILSYHERVGSGSTVHPYCSNWYTWILMLRPVAYFYQITDRTAPLPSGKSLAPLTDNSVIYDVHAIGNPVLWWLSSAAMLLVLWVLGERLLRWLRLARSANRLPEPDGTLELTDFALSPTEIWLLVFLAVNYAANLLPWVRVSRCVFLYHYMGASVFATLAIAWMIDRWLSSPQPRLRTAAIAMLLLVGLAFLFWLPIYLGLPLSPLEFRMRMWLPTWV